MSRTHTSSFNDLTVLYRIFEKRDTGFFPRVKVTLVHFQLVDLALQRSCFRVAFDVFCPLPPCPQHFVDGHDPHLRLRIQEKNVFGSLLFFEVFLQYLVFKLSSPLIDDLEIERLHPQVHIIAARETVSKSPRKSF
ncbi:hypothetical protein LP415_19220 [Polaromonas sp. P1(28)-8]|nr:hypothetical protein LP415_19220 [Polaromonas sp. P1(28)-8]